MRMLLNLKNIYKNYGKEPLIVPVLKDVSLEVKQGDYVAIMGPSGSGKTTLMNIIGCLDRASTGTYLFEDEDISEMNDDALSDLRLNKIGFVFQNFNLLSSETAQENVALPLIYAGIHKEERNHRADVALSKVGLQDRTTFKPSQLSGGQKQRVAIARALINHPRILLADEPTGALDQASGKQVMELFKALNDEGVTIIMITHDASVASHAKKILHIIEGISLSTVINIPIIFILFSLISVFFIIKVLYKTIYLEGSVTIFNQRKSRSKVINFKGSINILKNYFLLLFNIKEIFLEYIFSFLIIFIIVIRTELKSSPEIIFQFIVLFSLISNGVIYSYKRWYSFHPKKIFNTILKLDTVIFTITNILISTTISLIVLHEFKFDYIAFNFMTYILLTFIQKKLNLEYVNDGKSSVIFILLYGVISFVSFIILQNGVSLCINYLKG